MSLNIEAIHNENVKAEAPSFRAGDTVTVNVKVIEGTKERIQPFQDPHGPQDVRRRRRGTHFPGELPPYRIHRPGSCR